VEVFEGDFPVRAVLAPGGGVLGLYPSHASYYVSRYGQGTFNSYKYLLQKWFSLVELLCVDAA
jgi:hypothetical protein